MLSDCKDNQIILKLPLRDEAFCKKEQVNYELDVILSNPLHHTKTDNIDN
jgi:hypothetical protein